MSALQALLLTLVAVVGLLTVRTHDPVRQTCSSRACSACCSGSCFFVFQAPDVALSELVDRQRRRYR